MRKFEQIKTNLSFALLITGIISLTFLYYGCGTADGFSDAAAVAAASTSSSTSLDSGSDGGGSSGGGGTWELVGTAGFSTGSADYVDLYVYDSSGAVPYVAYKDGTDDKGYVQTYNSGTDSWSIIGGGAFSSGEVNYISMKVISAAGRKPTVAYQNGSVAARLAAVRQESGGVWSDLGTIGFSAGVATHISLDIESSFTVAYNDSVSGGVIAETKDADWTETGATPLSAGTAEYVSRDCSAGCYIAYKDNSGGAAGKATLKKWISGTSSWDDIGAAGFSDGTADYVSLFVADFAPFVPYVFFKDGGNSNKGTLMKYDGGQWVSIQSKGFTPGSADYTEVYIYNNGGTHVPYVAFKDGANGNKLTVMKYSFSTDQWSYVGSAGISEGSADYVNLYVYDNTTDSTADIYVAFKDGANGDKITVMKYADPN